ncbi:MAG: pseudouridine synthase [Planctomycetota bacterium]
MTRQRLQKLMSACGVASRRGCEELISQGRVEVDGEIVTALGTQVDPETQQIRCDGRILKLSPQLYYLLNKPRGVICSLVGRSSGLRAIDFLPPRARDRRLYTIGRLDVDSEGALILTNDGELCHLVSHPRFGVRKTYRVEVEGQPDETTIEKMRRGVWLAEGRTGPVEIVLLHAARERSHLAVTLSEGKRREIRRLFARFGHEVRRLVRVSIGPVQLGELPAGSTRSLTPAEIKALREAGTAVIRLGGGSRPGKPARPTGAPAQRRLAGKSASPALKRQRGSQGDPRLAAQPPWRSGRKRRGR